VVLALNTNLLGNYSIAREVIAVVIGGTEPHNSGFASIKIRYVAVKEIVKRILSSLYVYAGVAFNFVIDQQAPIRRT